VKSCTRIASLGVILYTRELLNPVMKTVTRDILANSECAVVREIRHFSHGKRLAKNVYSSSQSSSFPVIGLVRPSQDNIHTENIHIPSGIRTYDPRVRAVENITPLRARGLYDLSLYTYKGQKQSSFKSALILGYLSPKRLN
jgi:hypothetical protein